MRILKPSTMEISYFPTHGEIYEFRKYHSSVVFGKYFIAYGGLNPKSMVLDSCIVLNLVTQH